VVNPSSKEEAAETIPAASALVSSTTHLRVVLDLETSAASATTGGLELASLGADVWLDAVVCVRFVWGSTVAEVALGFTSGLASAEDNGVLSLRGEEGKLVESKAFAAGLDNLCTSTFGELECADGQLRAVQETDIVGHGGDNDSGLGLGTLHVSCQTRDGERRSVDARHVQTFQDNLVDLGVGTTCKETVQLHKKFEVNVLGQRSRTVLVTDIAATCDEINTHVEETVRFTLLLEI